MIGAKMSLEYRYGSKSIVVPTYIRSDQSPGGELCLLGTNVLVPLGLMVPAEGVLPRDCNTDPPTVAGPSLAETSGATELTVGPPSLQPEKPEPAAEEAVIAGKPATFDERDSITRESSDPSVTHVQAVRLSCIPGRNEALISAVVKGRCNSTDTLLFSPNQEWASNTGLEIEDTLVLPDESSRVKMLLCNPTPFPVKLNVNDEIGMTEPIDPVAASSEAVIYTVRTLDPEVRVPEILNRNWPRS